MDDVMNCEMWFVILYIERREPNEDTAMGKDVFSRNR